MQDILNSALQSMPNEFSSNQFSKKAQQLGLSKDKINEGTIGRYLTFNCNRGSTIRTWQKKVPDTMQPDLFEPTEEMCIRILKEKGYKIMKFMEI
jgi:hypothetical protein